MHHQPAVPRDFLSSFDYDIQELMSNTVKLNQSADALAAELEKAYAESERLQAIIGSQHVEHQQFRSKAEAAIRELECDVQSQQERRINAEAMLSSLEAQRSADMHKIQVCRRPGYPCQSMRKLTALWQQLEDEIQRLNALMQVSIVMAPRDGRNCI